MISTKLPRTYIGERRVSSINGAGKRGYLSVFRRMNWSPNFHHIKINSKWVKNLDVTPERMQIPEENMGKHLRH